MICVLITLAGWFMPLTVSASGPEALPAWAQTHWTKHQLGNTFSRGSYARSGLLRADFNGDGKSDVAVLVVCKTTGS